MNTRQAWDTAEDDWTPNEPTQRVINQAVKGFREYKRREAVLDDAGKAFTAWKRQEQRDGNASVCYRIA